MISQSFEPSRGRVAKVLVLKLLRAVEAEKQGLKNRVWPHLVFSPFTYTQDLPEATRNGPNWTETDPKRSTEMARIDVFQALWGGIERGGKP